MQLKTWAVAVATAFLVGTVGTGDAWARDFEFNVLASPPGGAAYWIEIGDANNDGRDDLVGVTPIGPSTGARYGAIQLRLQKDDATLADPTYLSVPLMNIRTAEVVDLDGDGQNSLVAGYDGGLIEYRWNGTEFVPTTIPSTQNCWYMVVGDLDGNGNPDFVCQSTTQHLSIYYTDDAGNIAAPTYLGTTTPYGFNGQLKIADVTGDGWPDLISTERSNWAFHVFANDGMGRLLRARAYSLPRDFSGRGADSIEAYDIDADGSNEILMAMSPGLLVFRRDANGWFRYWKTIASERYPDCLAKFDVDGDGYQDLMACHDNGILGRYMGSASGLSSTEIRSKNMWFDGSGGLAFGDLNDDGRTDLAHVSGTYSVKYGMGKRPQDFNVSHQSDLIWRDDATGRNTFWPDANSAKAQALPELAAPWVAKASGDFNGDDRADVLWRNPTNGANMIWLGANPATVQATAPLATSWNVVGSGDFNGDRRDDILWRNATTHENVIWLSGRQDTTTAVQSPWDANWRVVGIGDFDGDRVDDLLWRHSVTGANSVWFSANVATSMSITAVNNLAWKVVGVGDFNRDGMDDVVWRNAQSGANTIWRSASSARQQAVATVSNLSWSVAMVGDYDGDGIADLVWRNTTGNNLLWPGANVAKQSTLGTAGTAWKLIP